MNQFLDKIHFTKLCAVIIIGAIYIALQGCGTVATIKLPDGKLAIYEGPKKATMWLKENGREVKYSGLSEPWWAPFVAILGGAASNATQRDTNINVKP